MNWQPFDTAPQDGTPILAFWPSLIEHEPRRGIISVCKKEKWYWVLECYGCHECGEPTHWMPLPEPPTSAPPSK